MTPQPEPHPDVHRVHAYATDWTRAADGWWVCPTPPLSAPRGFAGPTRVGWSYLATADDLAIEYPVKVLRDITPYALSLETHAGPGVQPAPEVVDHDTKIDPNPGGPDYGWITDPTVTLPTGPTAAEQRIGLARGALVYCGYFTEDEVSDDVAPRILEQDFHRRAEIKRHKNLHKKWEGKARKRMAAIQAARNVYHRWDDDTGNPVTALQDIGRILDEAIGQT